MAGNFPSHVLGLSGFGSDLGSALAMGNFQIWLPQGLLFGGRDTMSRHFLTKKKHFAGVPLFELVSLPYRSHFIQQPAVFTTSNFYQCHRVDSRVVGRRRHYHMVLEHRIKRHGGVSPTPLPQPSTQTLVRVHARPSHISSLSPRILRQYFSLSTISYPPRNTRARPAKLLSR